MLARMNFAAQLATNQRFDLRDTSRGHGAVARGAVSCVLDRLSPPAFARDVVQRAARLRARRRRLDRIRRAARDQGLRARRT